LQGVTLHKVFGLILLCTGFAVSAIAQENETTHFHQHPVLMSIEEAKESGRISMDDAILQKYFVAYSPEKLDSEFRLSENTAPIKCMVPITQEFEEMRPRLKASTITAVEAMTNTASVNTEHTYVSPSGRFIFHYETTGNDAVPDEQTLPAAIDAGIPDYIYKAAFAADSSYLYQVETLGFSDFSDGDGAPYEIRFDNFGFYGTTTSSGSSTFITLHNSFNGFPSNAHPEGNQIGALYVTIAHEIKHAIQYEANRWRGSAGSFNWIEMDATMMEEVVFDNVDDYYNYIKTGLESTEPSFSSIFGAPQNPIPGAYYHITWMLYFAQTYGIDFWVDVWDEVSENPEIPFIDAIDTVLLTKGELFAGVHVMNHLWHLGAGENFAGNEFGFEESAFYPNPLTNQDLQFIPDSLNRTGLRPFAANYFRANSLNIAIGRPRIRLEATVPGVGVGAIGLFTDGTAESLIAMDEVSLNQQLQTEWDWNNLDVLYIAVVNTSRSRIADYKIALESAIPEVDILARNYPNPFNPTTRIEFSINSAKNVRIDIYDSIGRRIETLINRSLNEGFHFVDFDGSGLASGVYFYRIRTNEQTLTQKMLLVK